MNKLDLIKYDITSEQLLDGIMNRMEKEMVIHAKNMYGNQVGAAKARGMEAPTYTKEKFVAWCMSQDIFKKLYLEWVVSSKDRLKAPSCDRIDDFKSYTLDNIQLMSFEENTKKANNDRKNGTGRSGIWCKEVYCYDLEGKFLKSYHSQQEASRDTGCNQSNIKDCCMHKNGRRSIGGYMWEYGDSATYGKEITPYVEKPSKFKLDKSVVLVSKDKTTTKEFASVREAIEFTGVTQSMSNRALNGTRKTAGGYIWKYKEG